MKITVPDTSNNLSFKRSKNKKMTKKVKHPSPSKRKGTRWWGGEKLTLFSAGKSSIITRKNITIVNFPAIVFSNEAIEKQLRRGRENLWVSRQLSP